MLNNALWLPHSPVPDQVQYLVGMPAPHYPQPATRDLVRRSQRHESRYSCYTATGILGNGFLTVIHAAGAICGVHITSCLTSGIMNGPGSGGGMPSGVLGIAVNLTLM